MSGTLLLYIVLFITCFFIVYQDFKEYKIAIHFLILSFVLSLTISLKVCEYAILLKNILLNVSFLVLNLLAVWLYLMIKYKKSNILSFLGLGDILFFLVLCVSFSIMNFVLFQIISLIFAFLFHIVFRKMGFIKERIPLAGYQSVFFVVIIIFDLVSDNFNRFGDNIILSFR